MCKCAKRLREILRAEAYVLQDGTWSKGDDRIVDSSIENHHFRIIAMRPEMWGEAAKSVAKDVTRQLGNSGLV